MELPDPTEVMRPMLELYKKEPYESINVDEILRYKDPIDHVIVWLFKLMVDQYRLRTKFYMTDTIKARLVQHILINTNESYYALDKQFDSEMYAASAYGTNGNRYE